MHDYQERLSEVNWVEKQIENLIEVTRTASQRSRYVFLIINITGAILLISSFNQNFPYSRLAVYDHDKFISQYGSLSHECDNYYENHLNKIKDDTKESDINPEKIKALKDNCVKQDYFKSKQKIYDEDLNLLSIQLLGLKLYGRDVILIGSISMSVLLVWLYYCTRSEFLAVREIYNISRKYANNTELTKYIYSAVSHEYIFLISEKFDKVGEENIKIPYMFVKILKYIPFWVPLLAIITDLVTLFISGESLRWWPNDTSQFNQHWNTRSTGGAYWLIEISVRTTFTIGFNRNNKTY